MRRVAIRAEANQVIGGGHVMRCLALASAFRDAGAIVAFAATPETFALPVAQAQLSAFERLTLVRTDGDEPTQIKQQWRDGADVLVVDHYKRGKEFEIACRNWAKRIIVLDDSLGRRHDADVLVCAGAPSPELFRPMVPASCKILAGPNYALIRPELMGVRLASLARRDGRRVERIFVSFGASAIGDRSGTVLAALHKMGFTGSVDIVSSSPAHRAIDRPFAASFHSIGADMPALMCAADIGIGSAGTTAWERCCLGLPSLFCIEADNQSGVAAILDKAGAGINLGDAERLVPTNLASTIVALIDDTSRRARMAAAGAILVDGHGARRIVAATGLQPLGYGE
jgi:UDP-2,4-diacetamido-2,4,6-trideoxy-beta-L-altropyranose hydrolase